MLSRESWWPRVEHLEIGRKQRVPHDCGDGSPLIISRDDRGWHAYCFRCLDIGWEAPPKESLAEKVARIEKQRAADETLPGSALCLPMPRVYDVDQWPEGAKLWLYKAGISREDIGVLRIYWHPASDRVVVPVLSADGSSIFYQARAWQKGRTPKYLGPTPRPADLLPKWGSADMISLTEDLLSAIKIGMASGEGICLLGTKISDHIMAHLMRRRCHVNVVLDPDPPGQRGARSICAQLAAYSVPHSNVILERDPKLLTLAALKEKLSCLGSASAKSS